MYTSPPKILIFDSGLGGLSVTREIHRLVPQAQLVYYGDTAFFPYGSKPEDQLVERVLRQIAWLEQQLHPELIVIACNTASTLVLPALRSQTATPVVGVVPAIKPAAAHSDTGVIGLLATPGTVQRDYTTSLIEQHAGDCEVIAVGSTELVLLAEGKLRGRPPSKRSLKTILEPFLRHPRHDELDTLVLACTHFPLLREELAEAYGTPVHWVDSGLAIAQRVAFLLADSIARAGPQHAAQHSALFSEPPAEMDALQPWLAALQMRANTQPKTPPRSA
jgi:glutamate racemase